MKLLLILSFIFMTNCSYLGYVSDLNIPKSDPKIEALRQEEAEIHPFSIMQGFTSADLTDIKVIAKKDLKLAFKVFKNEKEIKSIKIDKVEAGPTGYVIHQLRVTGLELNTNYILQVLNKDQILDQRNFTTVSLDLTNPKIGVVSCLNDKFKDLQFEMWQDYLKHTPNYTFMIGDNVYADNVMGPDGVLLRFKYATADILWKRYIETFNIVSYYRTAHLIPTLGIWDDHDYGHNGGDGSYPYKKEALKIFEAFYGIKDLPNKSKSVQRTIEKIGGAGYIFRAFGQSFVFIDARFDKSTPDQLNTKDESHLGFTQTSKIMNELDKSKSAWLIKGDQFFGAYHQFESFEKNHPNDFKKFLNQIKNKKSKVFFVSGDRHLNEIMKIEKEAVGYDTYELTSSSIHATVYPNSWKKTPNPRQIQGVSGVRNYSMVSLKKDDPWTLQVQTYGPKMKLLFEEELQIK